MAESQATVTITVSNAEKGQILKSLAKLSGVELEYADLDAGDYLVGNGVAVERKSATDFILSVVDRHLPDEVGKLATQHERPVYIIEGDLYEERFHQKAFDVHMALSWMAVRHGIPVMPSNGPEASAVLIYAMAMDAQHRLERPADHRGQDPKIRGEAQRYLVEGLPGVDAERAEALLGRFGSPQGVFSAGAEELAEVEGLDAKQAQRIRNIIEKRWHG